MNVSINDQHLPSWIVPPFPRGGLEGVSTVESTLAGPPCSPPLEKGGRAESLPVQFLSHLPSGGGASFSSSSSLIPSKDSFCESTPLSAPDHEFRTEDFCRSPG